MMNVKFEFNDDRLRQRLSILADKVLPYIKATWFQIAKSVMHEAVLATPPPRSAASKDLRTLWEIVEEHPTDAITQFTIQNTYKPEQVLLYFEYGTKAHSIFPVRAKVLHFFINGEEIFAKNVRHPGTPAWKMFETAERRADVIIEKYMTETFNMVDQMLAVGGSAQ